MNKSDFHVGQTIYIGSRVGPGMTAYLGLATITSIGRKWVSFKYLPGGFQKNRFDIESGLVDNGAYSPDKVAVLDPAEYYDLVDARRLRYALFSFCQANCK